MTEDRDDSEERRLRIDALLKGPWADAGERALEWLKAFPSYFLFADPDRLDLRGDAGIELPVDEASKLSRALRPHWHDEIESDLWPLRESLDEALGILQLTELAILTGYIDADVVADDARQRMRDLLWSDAAKIYVREYGFIGVLSLATRLGVQLFDRQVPALSPIVDGDIHFAAFLAELTSWFGRPLLDQWLNFLDDYEPGGITPLALASVLSPRRVFARSAPESTMRITRLQIDPPFQTREISKVEAELLLGADLFITQAARALRPLTPDEIPLFGAYLSYWLTRFFGFELHGQAFLRSPARFDWGYVLSASPFLSARGEAEYHADIEVLRTAWAATKAYLEDLLSRSG